MKPLIANHDAQTGNDEVREMTDEEYQALLDSGWTPGPDTETTEP